MKTETYNKKSSQNVLSISLTDLKISEDDIYGFGNIKTDYALLANIIINTPTNQSHLGVKFDKYTKLNNSTANDFVKKIYNALGVKNVYVFENYTTKKQELNNLFKSVSEDKNTFICYRTNNGIYKSLYMGLRNALAHGNVVCKNNMICLYSVSDDKNEYTSPVSFFLKIDKIAKIQAVIKVLEQYK